MQRDARELRHQPVGDLRRHAARPQVVHALLAPAADDVVAFVELREQLRNFLGRVLQIAVHGDDHLAGGGVESGGERGRLPVVARKADRAHVRVARRQHLERLRRAVAAAVVHVDDFRSATDQKEHRREAARELLDRPRFVEERDDDRQLQAACGLTTHVLCCPLCPWHP